MEPLHVLLLEDSKLDADLAAAYLKNSGLVCEITRVETEEQFAQALASNAFDLILADYALPDFDGQSALEMVRKASADIPFIFVSGVLGEEVAIDSLRQGATDYVVKNRLERLGPAVKRALSEQVERRERQRTETALREAEMRHRLLVDSVQEYALFMTDAEGRITLWNRGAERLFGYLEGEVLGKPVQRLYPAEAEIESAEIRGEPKITLEDGHAVNERWLLRRDGAQFWSGGVTTPVWDESGQLQGHATVIRDNTERKRAEEERADLLGREQQARADAEQRAAELTEANAALARSNAQLEQFAYAASHDLQEPLRMVKSFTQLLAQRYKGKLDAKAEEMLHFIEAGSGRMQRLVDDLLSYSRVLHDREQGKQLVDLNALVEEVLFYFSSKLEETGAEVTREVLPSVLGNSERIGLVLQNLLSNALKYQDSRPPRIHISATRHDNEYIISVRDNGIGFDPQYADRIFGLFKRLHRAEEYPGTGVGLALCKQIIEQHGGRIWADSKPGQGSTFFFSLPGSSEEKLSEFAGIEE